PAIHYDGMKFSFIREIIMLSVAYFSHRFADQRALKGNEFNFEPIREVAFIFVGIFGTMMPALVLVGNFAQSPAGAPLINHNTLFWGTGALSGFLDNAPTYLNFLAAAMASKGADINQIQDYSDFAWVKYLYYSIGVPAHFPVSWTMHPPTSTFWPLLWLPRVQI